MYYVVIIRQSFIFQCQSEVFIVNEPRTNSFAKDLGGKMETQKVFIFFKDVCFQANQSITASAQLLKSISNLTELFLCLRGSRAPFIFLKFFIPSS